MPITSGSVRFERKVNTGDYSHKIAEGHIAWTMEGETRSYEDVIAEAGSAVVWTVEAINTYQKPASPAVTPETVNAPETIPIQRKTRQPRFQPNQEASTSTITSLSTDALGSSLADVTEPVEATPTATVVEITDRDLTDACSQKNQTLKNGDKIRGLIFTYTKTVGASVVAISQDKRQAFLNELRELQ